jgi:hypothetical protein
VGTVPQCKVSAPIGRHCAGDPEGKNRAVVRSRRQNYFWFFLRGSEPEGAGAS